MSAPKALVIDDSKAARLIVRHILSGLGYEIEQAANGKEALEYLKAHPNELSLALVDWNMPEMNGFEFVKAVRSDEKFESIRLIMVTAETDISRVEEALVAGANEYVMKPFTKEMIQEKLAMVGLVQI